MEHPGLVSVQTQSVWQWYPSSTRPSYQLPGHQYQIQPQQHWSSECSSEIQDSQHLAPSNHHSLQFQRCFCFHKKGPKFHFIRFKGNIVGSPSYSRGGKSVGRHRHGSPPLPLHPLAPSHLLVLARKHCCFVLELLVERGDPSPPLHPAGDEAVQQLLSWLRSTPHNISARVGFRYFPLFTFHTGFINIQLLHPCIFIGLVF